ncbi:MAG: carbohydrate ABC transporter permease [bacterium]|nr:carbohydrate ABC transporter permease [bacterium]
MNKKTLLKIKKNLRLILSFLILSAGVLVMILPFLWMLLTSFKNYAETVQLPIVWFPKVWTLENYAYVLEKMNFLLYYKNSIIMVVGVVAGQLLVCSMAGYAFARIAFRFRKTLFLLLLAVMMVPGQMTIIARYLLIYHLRLSDTYAGLILPLIPSIFGVFLLRQFFMGIPRELEDAARIDGCNYWGIYSRIMLPLAKGGMVTLAIFAFNSTWNDLMWPLIITDTEKRRVLAVAVAAIKGIYDTKNNLLMAASVMVTLPCILVFALGQKQFIEGVASTGIKG